jgi:MFS family permease
VNAEQAGWASLQTLGLIGAAVALLVMFIAIEANVKEPLVPLGLFKLRNITISNIVGVLWAAAMFAWFFLSALYMQLVLGYGPMQVGLAFLPANLIMGAFSYSLSAKLVNRFGIRRPLAAGLACAAAGLALFAMAPATQASFVIHVLPAMLLLGIGAGMAFNPVLLAAMSDVEPKDSGLASGIVNTSFMMGGSLGLAVLASVAAARTNAWLAHGADTPTALTAGYSLAFLVGTVCAGIAAVLGLLLRERKHGPGETAAAAPH